MSANNTATEKFISMVASLVTLTVYLVVMGVCFGLVGAVAVRVYDWMLR